MSAPCSSSSSSCPRADSASLHLASLSLYYIHRIILRTCIMYSAVNGHVQQARPPSPFFSPASTGPATGYKVSCIMYVSCAQVTLAIPGSICIEACVTHPNTHCLCPLYSVLYFFFSFLVGYVHLQYPAYHRKKRGNDILLCMSIVPRLSLSTQLLPPSSENSVTQASLYVPDHDIVLGSPKGNKRCNSCPLFP